KAAGFEDVVAGLFFTLSPVPTHEIYAQPIPPLDDFAQIDSPHLKEPPSPLPPPPPQTPVAHPRAPPEPPRHHPMHHPCQTSATPAWRRCGCCRPPISA